MDGSARARTLEALAATLVPPGEVPGDVQLPAGDAVPTAARAAELIDRLPGTLRRAVNAQLALLERLPRLSAARTPFSALPLEARERVVGRLDGLPGSLSEATTALKLLMLLAYTGTGEVTAALGVEQGQLIPLTKPLPAAARLPVREGAELAGLDEEFDAVIVGSGAGGAPVARELARAGWSVAVVEEGRARSRDDFTGPEIDRMPLLWRDGAATFTVGRPSILMPLGRAVGGSTVGNSGTCFRTPEQVVAGWADDYGADISPDDLGSYYEDVERTIGVAPVPWKVMGNNGLTVHRGAEALGIPGKPLHRNASGCRGSGVCTAGCPVDGKRGAHLNYLPQAVEAGAVVFAGLRVSRVLFDRGRAAAVKGDVLAANGRPAGRFMLRARRVVVVAAGAPLTPPLLRRSGLRITGLGRHLHIHPAGAVSGTFDEEIRGWRGVMQSYGIDAMADRGVMLEATFPPPGLGYAESGLDLPGLERKRKLAGLAHTAVLGMLVSDTSRGRVVDLGAGRTPLMTYSLNTNDTRRMLDGMLLASRVLFAAGATEVHPMVAGAGTLRSPAEAEAVLGRDHPPGSLRLTAYHPMGTARMGVAPVGVVDGFGRVHAAERLVVPDASVFPTSLGVNPQVTIMAFATRAAHRMLDEW
ncbi:MAG TPA: GMC family oxidoreductase [Actinomycetota bacterium]